MVSLQEWETAQLKAKTPVDWRRVDKLAAAACSQGLRSIEEIREAARLGLQRLQGSTRKPAFDGPDSETWIEALVFRVWHGLGQQNHCARSSTPLETNIERLPFLAHCIGEDNKLVGLSRPWIDVLGYDREELIGRRSTEFLTDKSRKRAIDEYLPRFWEEGHLHGIDYEFVGKTGKIVPVSLSAVVEFATENKPARSMAILTIKK